MINIDFSSVPSREALPDGMYNLQIDKIQETVSPAGNPMWSVTFNVLEVEGKRKLWDNFVFVEQSLWRVKEFFDALGLDTSEIVSMEPEELLGYTVQARVTTEDFQGEARNRIKKYFSA